MSKRRSRNTWITKYRRRNKASVADYARENKHQRDTDNLKLIKTVHNKVQLNAFKSREVLKCKNKINNDREGLSQTVYYLG